MTMMDIRDHIRRILTTMTLRTSAVAFASLLLAGAVNLDLHAAPIVMNLTTGEMTSSQFNSVFKPMASAPVIDAAYQFMTTPVSGYVESQVFQGTGAAAGLYAYAYQFVVNPVTDSSGQATSVNSATLVSGLPNSSNLIDNSSATYSAYVVKDGQIGGIDAPSAGASGLIQSPGSITGMFGPSSTSLTFQFLDPKTGSGPLEAGAHSATIVVLSTLPFTTKPVSLQNSNPQISYPVAYSATVYIPREMPVPEPSTLFGWAAVIGGGALLRHRKRRARGRAGE
jgi:hypothetical protein